MASGMHLSKGPWNQHWKFSESFWKSKKKKAWSISGDYSEILKKPNQFGNTITKLLINCTWINRSRYRKHYFFKDTFQFVQPII